MVGEFIYGYGNNYAGVNISNLDVFLRALQKYAPQARVIVFYQPEEAVFLERLVALFPIHAQLPHPVSAEALAELLRAPC